MTCANCYGKDKVIEELRKTIGELTRNLAEQRVVYVVNWGMSPDANVSVDVFTNEIDAQRYAKYLAEDYLDCEKWREELCNSKVVRGHSVHYEEDAEGKTKYTTIETDDIWKIEPNGGQDCLFWFVAKVKIDENVLK